MARKDKGTNFHIELTNREGAIWEFASLRSWLDETQINRGVLKTLTKAEAGRLDRLMREVRQSLVDLKKLTA